MVLEEMLARSGDRFAGAALVTAPYGILLKMPVMCHFTYSLLHKYLLNEQARAGFFSGGRDEQTQSLGWVQLSMSFVWMCLPCDWVGILLTPEYLPLNEAEVHIP